VQTRRRWAGWWGLAAAFPFLALAVRTLTETSPTFLQGDLALLHVDSLRAAGLHLVLGPYDRFGWHHPGPAYGYLMSLADRLEGFTRPLQAEALTALVVAGGSLAGSVVMARRHLGPGPAAGILILGWMAAIGLGNDSVFNPWPPTVVILPMVLLGVLVLAGLSGAGYGAAGGSLLVGTFCLQTDVGTAPYVVVGVLVTLGSALWRRPARTHPGAARAAALAVVVAVGAWIPVALQELSSRRGNLTALYDFFRISHAHAGLTAGVRAAGWAQLAAFGDRPPGVPPVGAAGAWAVLAGGVLAGVGLVVSYLRKRPVAIAGTAWWLLGTAVAVGAGTEIVGAPYSYLTFWAAAPLAGAAVAAGDLAASGLVAAWSRAGRRTASVIRRTALAVAVAGSLGLTVHLGQRRAVSSYSAAALAKAWSEVGGGLGSHQAVGVAYPNQPATWNIGTGLVDRLESTGHLVAVLPFWSNQVTATTPDDPAAWISVLGPGASPPPGSERLGTVGGVLLVISARPAPAAG
jgi:hypothetical protein